MVSWKLGLLILGISGSFLRYSQAVPINQEDNENGRSYKRELELFNNEVQDNWEHDDHEYLSRRELEEEKLQKTNLRNSALEKTENSETSNDENKSEVDAKRWLDVDSSADGSKQSLSPAEQDELPKDGELFQGDIVMDGFVREVFNGEAAKRDAVSLKSYYWPKGIVHYEFDPEIDRFSKMQIKRAIKNYHQYTCIRFIQRNNDELVKDYVRFISNGSACYSNVGRRHGMQKVSIGSGCYRVGTPIHELMHVLGFFHEMARPDRDESVVIHWENIKEGLKHNFRKMPVELDKNLDIEYNYNSVLHYSNLAFSKNNKYTITARTDPEKQFGQRCGFSVGDVREINRLYNCPYYNLRLRKLRNGHTLCRINKKNLFFH